MGSLTKDDKIKRFLYGLPNGIFISREHPEHITLIEEKILHSYWQTNSTQIIELIQQIDTNPLLIQRKKYLFYLLYVGLINHNLTQNVKQQIRQTILTICHTDDEFMEFIHLFHVWNKKDAKFPTSLQKLTVQFYQNKNEQELLKCVLKTSSFYGWTHKDIFRLCHLKFPENSVKELILKSVLDGDWTRLSDHPPFMEFYQKIKELHKTTEPAKTVELLQELNLDQKHINSILHKNEQIWTVLIAQMELRQLLYSLTKLYKMNLLKNGTNTQSVVLNELVNKTKASKMHPLEMYFHLKSFEKGGKPLNPKLIEYLKTKHETTLVDATPNEIKCPLVIGCLKKCLTQCYQNVKTAKKRFMVVLDNSTKLSQVGGSDKILNGYEVIYGFLKWLLKVETNLMVVFSQDNAGQDVVTPLDFNRSFSYDKMMEKFTEQPTNPFSSTASIRYAMKNKKPIDVFIIIQDIASTNASRSNASDKNLMKMISDYKNTMRLQNTKVIHLWLNTVSIFPKKPTKNILEIVGFSIEVPRLIEAFYNDKFS